MEIHVLSRIGVRVFYWGIKSTHFALSVRVLKDTWRDCWARPLASNARFSLKHLHTNCWREVEVHFTVMHFQMCGSPSQFFSYRSFFFLQWSLRHFKYRKGHQQWYSPGAVQHWPQCGLSVYASHLSHYHVHQWRDWTRYVSFFKVSLDANFFAREQTILASGRFMESWLLPQFAHKLIWGAKMVLVAKMTKKLLKYQNDNLQ